MWYGAGALWKSMIAPIARQTIPATLIAPWLTTCRSITSSAIPSRSSASPPQLIGRTEKPNRDVMSATAPSAPGSTTPGWKTSNPIPAIPARKSSVRMFGSMRRFRKRVRNPGDTFFSSAPARWSVNGRLASFVW